jgi:protein-L-isoaspartate(D-aspartate) O-methyltransferase
MSPMQVARSNMVHQQIAPTNVVDKQILRLMEVLPREPFVPAGYQGLAYADIEIPLAEGSLLPPRLVAQTLQALQIQPQEKILLVSAGDGYLAACLARLGGQVSAWTPLPEQLESMRTGLAAVAIDACQLTPRDAFLEPPEAGAYDAVLVAGSVADRQRLQPLLESLGANGRLFAIVGEEPVMHCCLFRRIAGNRFAAQTLSETGIRPLPGGSAQPAFQF